MKELYSEDIQEKIFNEARKHETTTEGMIDAIHNALSNIVDGYGGPGPSKKDTQKLLKALKILAKETEEFLANKENF